jgi:hypothetical protein
MVQTGFLSMSHKEPSSTEVAYRVLEELEAFQGVYWREVKGEFHAAYDEIAIWILLVHVGDIARAHRRFRDVVSSRFYLARFTVSYIVATPDGEVLLDFLSGNDEIEQAGSTRPLGAKPVPRHAPTSIFRPSPKAIASRRHIH